jgi:response regulator RpfG family c-di-GMP phosphodiesterase
MNTNPEITTVAPSTFNLLLVDDEPNVLKSLRRVFRGSQYNIMTAENGAAGLEILKQHSFDLIVSDMRMPEMDGAEFLSHAAEHWPDTVRILLTGYADMESTIAAVNKGRIYSYCCKPWEDDDLKMRVNQALEQKQLREERQHLFAIINHQNQELRELNSNLEDKVEKRTIQLKQSLSRIDQANSELKKQYTDSIKAFAKIIEMRPGIKSGRSKYIAEKAREVALRLNEEHNPIKDIVYAAMLLQLGKMGLPDTLLNQPYFEMGSQQKKRYLNHAIEGWQLLKAIEPLQAAAEIVHHQYEHYDGNGFPSSLSGAEIPLGARILAVIRDYLDHLEGFVTGAKMSTQEAKLHLTSRKNTEYDPLVVDTFLQVLIESEKAKGERPIIEVSWTQLRAGMEAAEIICNNTLFLKNQILTPKNIDTILNLKANGRDLILKIRLGSD